MAGGEAAQSRETRSGLDPWRPADLPVPPRPTGVGWLGVVGPGVIVLGASIGSGEFLLGPAVFVRYGLSLLWVTVVAVLLQTVFNTEVMRYVLATGEPAFTGFMRTRPSSTTWAWFYVALYFLQFGWPAFAATAAGAVFFLFARRVPGPTDVTAIYYIGVGIFLACAAVLLVGRRIERTLELLNWVLVTCILGAFATLALLFVPGTTWLAGVVALGGFDLANLRFDLLPASADFFLLGALVAYSGAGGVTNIALGNWARDRGYGMGGNAGYIAGAIGGTKVALVSSGFIVAADAESARRWHGWWRIVRADQWGIFCCGAIAGMMLPALLYVTVLEPGTDIQGLGISAALASSRRVRAWRGGDVRAVYYGVLAAIVAWGLVALRLAQPIVLLKLGANVAGVVFIVASLLYVNTQLLPRHLRPPAWRRVGLVAVAVFYGIFVTLSLTSLRH